MNANYKGKAFPMMEGNPPEEVKTGYAEIKDKPEKANIYVTLDKILQAAFDGAVCVGGVPGEPGQLKVFYNARDPIAMLNMIFTACLNIVQIAMQIHAEDTAEDKPTAEEYKQHLWDYINLSASYVLHEFAPEIEMRPDLTAEAIMKAENEILESIPDFPVDPEVEDIQKKIEEAGE